MSPPVLFVALQTGAGANGGVASISKVITSLREHRPIVLTNLDTQTTRNWREGGIETHILPEAATSGLRQDPRGYIGTYLRYHRALAGLVRQSGARVIHANDPAAFQLSLSARRRSGAGLILNLRDTMDPHRKPPSRRYRHLFRAADHVLYLSNDMADRWTQLAPGAAHSWSVTYSIVELERFRPAPIPSGPPTVLLSGVVSPKKGQLDFLRYVAPSLADAGVRIRIAGDFDPQASAYAAACRAEAWRLGEAVTFLGYQADLPTLISEAHLVLVASRYEGLVRSMIEAMSCARPVVSTPVCSAREMLERPGEAAGAVVPFDEPSAMSEAILRFLANEREAVLAGQNGRLIAERLFQQESVVARYEDAYRLVAERR